MIGYAPGAGWAKTPSRSKRSRKPIWTLATGEIPLRPAASAVPPGAALAFKAPKGEAPKGGKLPMGEAPKGEVPKGETPMGAVPKGKAPRCPLLA